MIHMADPRKNRLFGAFYPHPANNSSLRVGRGSFGMWSSRRCPRWRRRAARRRPGLFGVHGASDRARYWWCRFFFQRKKNRHQDSLFATDLRIDHRRLGSDELARQSGGKLFHRDQGANDLFNLAVAEGVPHGVFGQFIGDRRHDHPLVQGQDATGSHPRRDVHRILKSQRAVNREAVGEGAEIGDRLVRGVTQGEERRMRGDDAVGHSGRMRHQGWPGRAGRSHGKNNRGCRFPGPSLRKPRIPLAGWRRGRNPSSRSRPPPARVRSAPGHRARD